MAIAVNDSGVVAGTAFLNPHYSVQSRAFIWTQSAGFVDLGTLPGDNFSSALDMNNQGHLTLPERGRLEQHGC